MTQPSGPLIVEVAQRPILKDLTGFFVNRQDAVGIAGDDLGFSLDEVGGV